MIFSDQSFEPHVHLHGCFSAEDLWEIGRDSHHSRQDALNWYAHEFSKAWGKTPEWKTYWTGNSEEGFSRLQNDYCINGPVHFSQFQASFNLVIALCPIHPSDLSLQKKILDRLFLQGIHTAHIRTVIPLRFSADEAQVYLENLVECFENFSAEHSVDYRFIISLPRETDLGLTQWRMLDHYLTTSRGLKQRALLGIDFACFEEGFPPKEKESFLKTFYRRSQIKNPLAVFYHVGESFDSMSQLSALRWIWEVSKMGAHRLGHALALGLDPESRLGTKLMDPPVEAKATAKWLLNWNMDPEDRKLLTPDEEPKWVTEGYALALRRLQNQIAGEFKDRGVVIECCPTSNERIGRIKKPHHHPLVFFQNQGLDVVVGSDDPGIFGTTLQGEHERAQSFISGEWGKTNLREI